MLSLCPQPPTNEPAVGPNPTFPGPPCRALQAFIPVTGSSILSKWYGESEANVRRLFEKARRCAPAVIFIDEVDSLLGRRAGSSGDGPGGASEASRRVTNEFLSYIDGIHTASPCGEACGAHGNTDGGSGSSGMDGGGRVVVIAATNAPWELDEAALSRFAARVLVPLPDARARVDILHGAMAGVACEMGEGDWRRVAELTEQYSGRDLMQVCREASMRPLRELWGNRVLEGGAPRHAQRQRQLVKAVAAALRRGVGRRRMRRVLEKWKREEGEAAWCDVDAVIAEAEQSNAATAGMGVVDGGGMGASASPLGAGTQHHSQQQQQLHQERQEGQQQSEEGEGEQLKQQEGANEADGSQAAALRSSDQQQQSDTSAAASSSSSRNPATDRSASTSKDESTVSGKDTWTVEELLSLPADSMRPVVLSDFQAALQAVSSTDFDLTAKFEEWSAKYGSGGGTKRREDAWRSMPMYL